MVIEPRHFEEWDAGIQWDVQEAPIIGYRQRDTGRRADVDIFSAVFRAILAPPR